MVIPLCCLQNFRSRKRRNERRDDRFLQEAQMSGSPQVVTMTASSHSRSSRRGDLTSSQESSNVHVQISDIAGDEDVVATTYFLKVCKSTILKPYTIILQLIGWRAFRKEHPTRRHLRWQLLNKLYPATIFLVLVYFAALQGIACPGRLDFVVPVGTTKNGTPPAPVTTTVGTTTISFFEEPDYPAVDYHENREKDVVGTHECTHRLTMYILPSVVQLAAFVYGFYMFRIVEVDEQLYALMERVFLQSSVYFAERIIISITRKFLMAAVLWAGLQVIVQVLYNLALESEIALLRRTFVKVGTVDTYLLSAVRVFGQLVMTTVEMAVILNYCTQSEMIIIYIKGITLRLREKRITIREVMHEILACRDFISHLNKNLGKVTACFLVNFAVHTVAGVFLFLLNDDSNGMVMAYRGLYPIPWFLAMYWPVYQASRVTSMGEKIEKISIETRVFGYQDAQEFELDSFLLFIGNLKIRARMFGARILPSTVTLGFGLVFLIVYVLIIAGALTNPVMGPLL
ncbi:uncharacterized protein LOC135377910 isoform X3 [Ornithodoros turicata]|uniref:uncharacterized protein LOC135377910 isoform X3 n=1 Tax=Ornithodoros turicata TaxID=34597 RepID=UPI00313A2C24